MKRILLFLAITASMVSCGQSKETFDLATYTSIRGWNIQKGSSAVQFSREDKAKGSYCLITLYKSVPGTNDPKHNFEAAWESLVKEMVKVSTEPEMQPSAKENGWDVLNGYAPFESDGSKGIAVLVTGSGFEKMVNIVILTNTDVYEKEISDFLASIDLKKPANQSSPVNKPGTGNGVSKPQTGIVTSNGFQFSTTNFDDGWTSTAQEDWVEVKKGDIKVLLHYPKAGTIFPADPDPLTRAAWDILVAPRYSNLRNFKTTYISTYDRPYIGSGYAIDNATGKEVYIVLYRQGQTGWIEFIAPAKNSFTRSFKADPDQIRWDSESDLLKPMAQMVSYNKFGIAAGDFKGTWTSDFTGVQQLYHVYTGNYAGMNINQSNQTFQFGPGNSYSWSFLAVNGMVGNTKYAQEKSSGRFTVLNNWQISFSDIENKPKRYNAFFSCIKGARLLQLLDADYPGSGIYTIFGRK